MSINAHLPKESHNNLHREEETDLLVVVKMMEDALLLLKVKKQTLWELLKNQLERERKILITNGPCTSMAQSMTTVVKTSGMSLLLHTMMLKLMETISHGIQLTIFVE